MIFVASFDRQGGLASDPSAAPLVIACVDSPAGVLRPGASLPIGGWAFSTRGRPVRVVVSAGRSRRETTPDLPRPDVYAALGGRFAGLTQRCGFQVEVELPADGAGILVEVTDGDVVARWEGFATIAAPPDAPRAASASPSPASGNGHRAALPFSFAALAAAELDAEWYLAAHADAATATALGECAGALDHYLKRGHREGKSPSDAFHERWYLEVNPDVAAAVRQGTISCGFEHYLHCGRAEGRAPRTAADLVYVIDAINGSMVRGWAASVAAPDRVIDLELRLDGVPVARTSAGLPRRDLLSVLPTANHGFEIQVPAPYCDGRPRALRLFDTDGHELTPRDGRPPYYFSWRYDDGVSASHRAAEVLEDLSHRLEELRGSLAAAHEASSLPLADYPWFYRRLCVPTAAELDRQRAATADFAYRPVVSMLLPVFDAPPALLDAAIGSVVDQVYDRWELCIADDGSHDDAVREVIKARARRDPRIKFVLAEDNAGIAANTNRALGLATGDYVGFLDHDDLLTPDALHCMVMALQERRWSLLYSDEDLVDALGQPVLPHLKPAFDYDFLLAVNYLCHLVLVDRRLAERAGAMRRGYEGCQDRDFLLRVVEQCGPDEVRHVPRVLYHWRVHSTSLSQTEANRSEILARSIACVQEHLDRCGLAAEVLPGDRRNFTCRVRWALPSPPPRASIVIPSKDRVDLLGPCVASLLRTTDYPDYEVVVVDHDSRDKGARAHLEALAADPRVVVAPYRGAFNWSAMNNLGAQQATGEVLVFLNNDVEALGADWLRELVGHALRPEVGAVGAKLLYEDGTVQHAGVVVGVGGFADHAFRNLRADDGGYLGRASCTQRVSAVTGACLATRRAVFDEAGGFDVAHLPVALNDVDYCLRIGALGYAVVWTPYAVLHHFESKSRGYDAESAEAATRLAREAALLRARWGSRLASDPYYNPLFDPSAPPYSRLQPPARVFTAAECARSSPLARRAAARGADVVALDNRNAAGERVAERQVAAVDRTAGG